MTASTGSLLMLYPAPSHAQGGVPLWTNRYDGPANGADIPYAIAVDSSGDVFVTGSSENASNSDYVTIKYSNAGAPLWTNHYDGPVKAWDLARAIAVDSSGNVFVTGNSTGTGGSSDIDYATIKYSNAGVPLWINRYDGPGNVDDQASAIAVDASGTVFVTGTSRGIGGRVDYATIAYSSAGTLLWTNLYDGHCDDAATAIAVDSSGNVFVTGESWSGCGTDHYWSDYATIKYSGTGLPLWTNLYNGPANGGDSARAIAVDSSGNVLVTGSSRDATQTPDYATIKYSSAGVPLWTNRYNGPANSADQASAVAVDSGGNVFVTGGSYAGIGVCCDYTTIKYSNAGVPLWTRRYNGPGNSQDAPYAIAVDNSGNVFVTGESYALNGSSDYATVAYSNAGVPLWTNRYNGPANGEDRAYGIAVDSSGNVFVTGDSWNGTNYDYLTIKYSSSVPRPRLDFQLLNKELVLSWTNAGFNLQSAPAVTGLFTNLPGATSPFTNALAAPQQFFRLISN